jgi:hypothetical protein
MIEDIGRTTPSKQGGLRGHAAREGAWRLPRRRFGLTRRRVAAKRSALSRGIAPWPLRLWLSAAIRSTTLSSSFGSALVLGDREAPHQVGALDGATGAGIDRLHANAIAGPGVDQVETDVRRAFDGGVERTGQATSDSLRWPYQVGFRALVRGFAIVMSFSSSI